MKYIYCLMLLFTTVVLIASDIQCPKIFKITDRYSSLDKIAIKLNCIHQTLSSKYRETHSRDEESKICLF
jgi:hypothetical protein